MYEWVFPSVAVASAVASVGCLHTLDDKINVAKTSIVVEVEVVSPFQSIEQRLFPNLDNLSVDGLGVGTLNKRIQVCLENCDVCSSSDVLTRLASCDSLCWRQV